MSEKDLNQYTRISFHMFLQPNFRFGFFWRAFAENMGTTSVHTSTRATLVVTRAMVKI